MILTVQQVELCGGHRLWLSFNDGTSGVADVAPLLEGPVFEPLKNENFFAKVTLDPVCGTVVWPNGADFAPEALHEILQPVNQHLGVASP
jgi:hypothetical protein